MTELVHADIFFFITAIVVVVVGIGMGVALFYIVLILRDVRAVTRKIRVASDELGRDFEELRATVKDEGARVRTIVELVLRFIMRHVSRGRDKKTSHETAAKNS